jgi:hypothetical protein
MDSKAERVISSLGVKASRSMTGLAFQFRVYGFLKWDLYFMAGKTHIPADQFWGFSLGSMAADKSE